MGRLQWRWRPAAALVLLAAAIVVLVVAGIGWGSEQRLDVRMERAVHRSVLAHRWLADSARALTHLGDPTVVTGLTVLLAMALLVRGRRRAALFVLVVRAVGAALNVGLKEAIQRPRPVLAHPIAHANGWSMPSGHAMGSAALWVSCAVLLTGLVRAGWRIAIAVLVPVTVALTRVLLGVHFVTDVVAGLLLGGAVALGMGEWLGQGTRGSPRLSPSDGSTQP